MIESSFFALFARGGWRLMAITDINTGGLLLCYYRLYPFANTQARDSSEPVTNNHGFTVTFFWNRKKSVLYINTVQDILMSYTQTYWRISQFRLYIKRRRSSIINDISGISDMVIESISINPVCW